MTRRQELQQKLAAANHEYKQFLDNPRSAAPGTDEYTAKVDEFETRIAELTGELDRERRREKVERSQQRESPVVTSASDHQQRQTFGFRNFGEFAGAVIAAGRPGGNRAVDERLFGFHADAPGSDYAQTTSGADGGFLIAPEFSARVRELALAGGNDLLPFCAVDDVSSNAMAFPIDETTPWGASGVRAYWEAEGSNLDRDKPDLDSAELRLKKLTVLVPATSEMVEDSTVLNTWLPRAMARAVSWKTTDAIVNGSGAGRPKGFANAANGSLITQAAEANQTEDTIVAGNVAKMYGRCLSPQTAVWIIHPDAWNQLPLMTIGDQPVWTPPSEGAKEAPNGRLLGRPIVLSDACQTLGDIGDIYFADLMSYQVITKSGGMQFATSMHVWFDFDMHAFRITFRLDGMPVFREPVTPPYSSVTRSPFVQLAERA